MCTKIANKGQPVDLIQSNRWFDSAGGGGGNGVSWLKCSATELKLLLLLLEQTMRQKVDSWQASS